VVEDISYRAVEDRNNCLKCVSGGLWMRKEEHTTLSVPTRTGGGVWLTDTISETKLAVMPMMEMSEMACIPRTTVKVAPRAPKFGPGILNEDLVILKIGLKGGRFAGLTV
jgi:hypothetical protein